MNHRNRPGLVMGGSVAWCPQAGMIGRMLVQVGCVVILRDSPDSSVRHCGR